jgi:hypothetical protein
VAALDQRLADAERTLEERMQRLTQQAESERRLLDERLQELATRIDDALLRARQRLAALEG